MRIAAITGGHSFDREAFQAFLESLPCDVQWVEHPEAIDFVTGGGLDEVDVSLHYDMPGTRPVPTAPPAEFVARIRARTESGHGFVVLHHALASWPLWDEWAELVGGRYLYEPGLVRGEPWPDSGYRDDVEEHLSCVDPTHPVLAGLQDGLDLIDETYLCPVFTDDLTPLLRTDAPIEDSVHFSTVEATSGRKFSRGDWHHPPGSPLAAWAKSAGRSRVVYIRPGNDGRTLQQQKYRKLVSNAISWTAEPIIAQG